MFVLVLTLIVLNLRVRRLEFVATVVMSDFIVAVLVLLLLKLNNLMNLFVLHVLPYHLYDLYLISIQLKNLLLSGESWMAPLFVRRSWTTTRKLFIGRGIYLMYHLIVEVELLLLN